MQSRITLLPAITMTLLYAGAAFAQIPNLTASTATPLPEYGHIYISARLPQGANAMQVFGGSVSEFVNPATGSLSWRICTTPPKGRQLSIPFCFVYDSAGVHHLENNAPGNLGWNTDASYFEQGGWTYSLPELTEVTRQEVNGSYVCDYATDYMFRDSEGGRHAMGLSIYGPAPGAPADSCSQVQPAPGGVTTGGEGAILATTSEPTGSFSLTPVTVTDADGTRYIFNDPGKQALADGFTAELPDIIEDRNGNEITIADSGSGKVSATDTVDRALVATSGFGASAGDSVQIAGESAAYTVDWGTATSNYSVASTSESGTCAVPGTVSGSQPVVTAIELPDGESFTFQYDATYGLLDRVTFPTGGYVRYVWGMNVQAEGGQFASASGSCLDRYGEPAITARYVSLDGSSEVLDQSFAYATTWPSGGASWSSKTTTVTNQDEVRGASFATDYAYSGYTVPLQPDDATVSTLEVPVEATITAKDWNGSTLRTTAETWNNPRELASKEITEDDGKVSEQTYFYDANEQQTERDEYDYGSGAPGALTRVTLHTYGCAPGVHIVDRPTVVEIEGSQRTVTAETEYAYDQSPLVASGATDGRDPAYAAGGGITARCNLTTLTKVNYTGNINETFTYDDAGNTLAHTDGNGNTSSYAYGSADQAAYITQITLPNTSTGSTNVQHSAQMAYDTASGLLTSRTDVQNASTISYVYNDPLNRLTEQDNRDGGKITYAYTANSVETKKPLTGSYTTDAFTHWGGLGNADRTLAYNGTNWDTTDTAFDGEQMPLYVSYPYFSSGIGSTKAASNSAEPGDTAAFDGLGRQTQTARSDGAVATQSYSGPATTITDEAGRSRELIDDGLGRLIEVKEYTDSSGDGYSTYYGYGSLDDLKAVTQGSETRTFDYDNLNRMMDATNPESGTADYTYDNDGNLIKQQDANGTVVSYSYDALNRLRSRSYTVSGATAATPSVEIDYDIDSTGAATYYTNGRMTRVISGSTSIGMDQYDAMGRLQTYDTVLGGQTYHSSMRFDYSGNPIWEEYPDGRKVDLNTDYEGRPDLLRDEAGYDYTHYRDYNAAGELASEEFGNGLVEALSYNSRQRPVEITVKNPNDQSNNTWRMDLAIAYTESGVQAADNGNVVSMVDNLGNAGQNYTMSYDQLNRIASWSSNGGTSCQYSVDQYGNLALASGTNCSMLTGLSFNSNNQIVGYSYDSSGNLLSNTAGTSYTWDGNSQLVSFYTQGGSASYVYDGLMRRVQKSADSVTTQYARDALGNVAASLTNGVWRDYIWADDAGSGNGGANANPGADRLAEVVGSGVGTVHFFHKDQVGTTRAITDENGANLASCGQNSSYPNGSFLTYTPFGIETDCTQNASAYKFTAHERDQASGLDHFRYRQFSPLQARWLTPDPAGTKAACTKNPQTQNRYSYLTDGPAEGVDHDGLFRLSYWNNPLVCSPPGEEFYLDGMQEMPCPWEPVISFAIPLVSVSSGCTCRSAQPYPVYAGFPPRKMCSYDCTCRGGAAGIATFEYTGLNGKCGDLHGVCPKFAQATRIYLRLIFGASVTAWVLTGCIR